MKTPRLRLAPYILLALAGLAPASARTSGVVRASAPQAAVENAALHELHGWPELQADFNQDHGAPRLILLLSPT
jgi:hypothetical protein